MGRSRDGRYLLAEHPMGTVGARIAGLAFLLDVGLRHLQLTGLQRLTGCA
jgi:hypothetical protein